VGYEAAFESPPTSMVITRAKRNDGNRRNEKNHTKSDRKGIFDKTKSNSLCWHPRAGLGVKRVVAIRNQNVHGSWQGLLSLTIELQISNRNKI
jgi:hypothetical protein